MVQTRHEPWRMTALEGKGKALITTRDVAAGELIIAEEPWISFTPIPKDVIYHKQWLTTGKRNETRANGKDTIAADISKLSLRDRTKFRNLHGTSPRGDGRRYTKRDAGYQDHDLKRVALNAFSDIELDEYQLPLHVERVFADISRINHSCRPNAVMSWNSNLHKGTVFAIRGINNEEEITICYYPGIKNQLCDIRDRCRMLSESHGFVCTCPACGPGTTLDEKLPAVRRGRTASVVPLRHADPNSDWARDMHLRQQARDQHVRINFDKIPTSMRESEDHQAAETRRQNQIQRLDQYITALTNLGIRDVNLAQAYDAKARNCELGMHAAKLRRELRNHAPAILPHAPPEIFLQEASQQWRECRRVLMRCCGEDNPLYQDANTHAARVDTLLLKLGH